MAEKKEKRTAIRWDKDNLKYVRKILRRYHRSPQYSLNRLLNHLIRQHRLSEAKDKQPAYHLKMELLDLAKQKEEISQQMIEKQIVYEAKRSGEEQEKTEKVIQKVRSPEKVPEIVLE